MSVRPLRADARRNRECLLSAAAAAFAEQGVDASLEDIARRAGVGIGTLYRHFPTRDALVEAVYRREVDQICQTATHLRETMPPDEALAEWMRHFVVHVTRKRGLAAAVKSVVAADSELFVEANRQICAATEALVADAVAAGTIRPDTDPADLLRVMSGVCLMGDQSGPPEQLCRVTGLLMDGLRYGAERAGGETTASR